MDNMSAGNGSPYWYEWSVGLLYVVKMLNPDNRISNVVLQSKDSQSLDDVVITYEDGKKEYIQVKHTEKQNILSYSDMIEGEKGRSYLYKYSHDWKQLINKNGENCKVILFTNRQIGTRKYTPKNDWQRPPLSSFWKEIKKQLANPDIAEINQIVVKEEWESAWTMWKSELGELTDNEKFLFLQNFDILAGCEDLDEIIISIADELQNIFCTSHEKAVGLHQKLCYQLMWWSTSMREKEEIEKEDVMQALTLSGDEIIGEHILPICEPFFKSRIDFIRVLEEKILTGKSRVTFLTGEPGCGKTNIISYLACKPNSIVTVRFHAFKPILPDDLYMSADSGISDPRAFWGSLLIMLRKLFEGKLYEYKVPISIELIDSVNQLRAEVIRLASLWAELSGKPTVIAVDGIDHAARSGNKKTFLRTLLVPEEVPENVRFLIAGQPVYQFSEYPDFLADSERIEVAEVPYVQKEDLELLYASKQNLMKYNKHEKSLIINYVVEIAKGNTLAAVFAMHEATKYSTFTDFEKNSNVNKLANGIQLYYEYIWNSTLEQAERNGYVIDMYIAAIFSKINRKVSAQTISEMFRDTGLTALDWESILQNLFPIIDYDQWGYSVFHNDVRLFLKTHYKKAKRLTPEISGKLANYLMQSDYDAKIKHELVFQLLKESGREEEYVDVFTCQYVIEGFSLKRNPAEIRQQMRMTLDSLVSVKDKRKIVKFSCAVTTMQQHKESLQWIDKEYEYDIELPFALESERRTVPDDMLSYEQIENMLFDVSLLVSNGEKTRAKQLLERWLVKKTPKKLLNYLEKEDCFDKELCDYIFKEWGKYARMLNLPSDRDEYISENEKEVSAQFGKGWLEVGQNYSGVDQIQYTLQGIVYYYNPDIERYFQNIIRHNPVQDVVFILSDKTRDMFSKRNQITACAWCVKNNRMDLCEKWLENIIDKKFNLVSEVEKKHTGIDKDRERFKLIVDIMYILSHTSTDALSTLQEMALKTSALKRGQIEYVVAGNILTAINYVAHIEKCVLNDCLDKIDSTDFKVTLDMVLSASYYSGCFGIETILFRKKIVESFIQINDFLPQKLQRILQEKLQKKMKLQDEVALFECYWRYLSNHGEAKLIECYFDAWMSKDGKLWKEELEDRDLIANVLINVAKEIGWNEKAQEATKLLNVRSIGYVGRKDYSLFTPLNWFERLAEARHELWKEEGLLLLNISEYASQIGDNRAAIQVAGTIAGVASKMGAGSLFQFACMLKNAKTTWKELVFDGVIAALETEYLTKEELLAVWTCATTSFMINEFADRYDSDNTRNKIYISDIHEAISLCAQRMGYDDVEQKMKEVASVEYEQKRIQRTEHSFIIPHRWYESEYYANMDEFISNTENMNFDEMFSYIESEYRNAKFSWDYIKYFIRQAKEREPAYIEKYKHKIVTMLNCRSVDATMEHDGSYRLYDELFPYLNEEEVTDVLKQIIRTYYYTSNEGWMSAEFGLMTDLDHFTYALFSQYRPEDNLWALQQILKMHCIWLNGSETLEMDKLYELGNEKQKIKGWSDFFKRMEMN